jgi:hypothetical protein
MKEDKAYQQSRQMEALRQALQILRGQNLFRGREEFFLSQGLLVLPGEQRGAGAPRTEVHIRFSDKEHDLQGQLLPGGPVFRIADFEMNLQDFMAHAVGLARGKDYLRTHPKQSDYRKGKPQ